MESAKSQIPNKKGTDNTLIELDNKLGQLHALQIDIAETSQTKNAAVKLASDLKKESVRADAESYRQSELLKDQNHAREILIKDIEIAKLRLKVVSLEKRINQQRIQLEQSTASGSTTVIPNKELEKDARVMEFVEEKVDKALKAERQRTKHLLAIGIAVRNGNLELHKPTTANINIDIIRKFYDAVYAARPLADACLYRDSIRIDIATYKYIYSVEYSSMLGCTSQICINLLAWYAEIKALHANDFEKTAFYNLWRMNAFQSFWTLNGTQYYRDFTLDGIGCVNKLRRIVVRGVYGGYEFIIDSLAKDKRSKSSDFLPLRGKIVAHSDHLVWIDDPNWKKDGRVVKYVNDEVLKARRNLHQLMGPLFDVGVAVRKRHLENSRLPGLCRRNDTVKEGNEAAHYGNAVADAILYSPNFNFLANEESLYTRLYLFKPRRVLELKGCKPLIDILCWRSSIVFWKGTNYGSTEFCKSFPKDLLQKCEGKSLAELNAYFGEPKMSSLLADLKAKYLEEAAEDRKRHQRS